MLLARRLLAHRALAAWLCAATLLLKLLVPAGYMIGDAHGRLTIDLCPGVASMPMSMAMPPALPRVMPSSPGHGTSGDHGKAELPCAFAGLAAASLGAVDPIQLAALVAFGMAIGLAPAAPLACLRRTYLRPPLRGPPAIA